MKQTIFINFGGGDQREYPVSPPQYQLNDRFAVLDKPEDFALGVAALGGDPMSRGRCYAYVLNRNPRYRHPYYGWGLERSAPFDAVAHDVKSARGYEDWYRKSRNLPHWPECCEEPRGFSGGVCDNCGGTVQRED